ncbi:thioredoxin domain-containing protein [Bacteriovoracaceae bacterium]|nr:thioredoxin domain-containing protein [Bacteriovoracaceae bacterium]
MKSWKILFLAMITLSSSYAIEITTKNTNKEAIEKLSASDDIDIDIVVLNPYWECGPCKLYSFYEDVINTDEALNALTFIGKIFNREVTLNTIEVSDEFAMSLGVKGYPVTYIFKEGKYLGEYTGAASLRQLAGAIDRLDDKTKYERRANRLLKSL